MGYVSENLLKDEEIKHVGAISWAVYLPAVLWLLAGLTLPSLLNVYDSMFMMASLLLIGVAIILFAKAAIFSLTTELVVTNKRVVLKAGLIERSTSEVAHNRIEGYFVDQGILGRVLSFGTIHVRGTGASSMTVPYVASPFEFRQRAAEVTNTKVSE